MEVCPNWKKDMLRKVYPCSQKKRTLANIQTIIKGESNEDNERTAVKVPGRKTVVSTAIVFIAVLSFLDSCAIFEVAMLKY